jgi:hypothetical protein
MCGVVHRMREIGLWPELRMIMYNAFVINAL